MPGNYIGIRKVKWDQCWHALRNSCTEPFRIQYDRVSRKDAQMITEKLFKSGGEPIEHTAGITAPEEQMDCRNCSGTLEYRRSTPDADIYVCVGCGEQELLPTSPDREYVNQSTEKTDPVPDDGNWV